MSTHNLCFRAKIRKMYTPVHPSFTIQKWGVMGYKSHGRLIMMQIFLALFCYYHERKPPWCSIPNLSSLLPDET